jgi:hypothetical protein
VQQNFDTKLIEEQLLKLRLRTSKNPTHFFPNSAYRELTMAMARVVSTGESESILFWPKAPKGLSTAHFFLQLAALSHEKIEISDTSLYTLYFPFGRAMDSYKDIYIDREWIHEIVKMRLRKFIDQEITSNSSWDTLKNLLRVSDLKNASFPKDDNYPHPIVDELSLTVNLLKMTSPKKLLYRSEKYTQLPDLIRGQLADRPMEALWCLAGLDRETTAFNNLDRIPNILFMDVTKKSVPWKNFNEYVELPLKKIKAKYGVDVPVLAITDTPWMFERLKYLLGPYGKQKNKSCAILNKIETLEEQDRTLEFVGPEKIWVRSTDVGTGLIVDKARKLSKKIEKEDFALSAALSQCCDRICNRINLPVSYERLFKFLRDESASDEETDDILRSFSPNFKYSNYDSLQAQAYINLLKEFEIFVNSINAKGTDSSPVYTLIVAFFSQLIKSPVNTLVVFQDRLSLSALRYAVYNEPSFGDSLKKLIDENVLEFVDSDTFKTKIRNLGQTYKRVLLIQPSKDAILDLITFEKLPDELVCLGGSEVLKYLVMDLKNLLNYKEMDLIRPRILALVNAVTACVSVPLATRFDDDGPFEFRFKIENRDIDLRGSATGGPYIKIKTSTGQNVLAWKTTRIIGYDRNSPVNPFYPISADQLEEGTEMCPIGIDFLRLARSTVYSKVEAKPEVRHYHKLIEEQLPKIIGRELRTKANKIRESMLPTLNELTPSAEAIISWINVKKWAADELNVLRPNAPQSKLVYDAFMKALDVNRVVAETFWNDGVLPTRSARLSKGHDFHETYMGILFAPEEVEFKHPEYKHIIPILRKLAEENVTIVKSAEMKFE